MCVAGGKKPTERIALETVFGCVRAGAARFLRQGVVPRYRGIASVHYYMLANCGPAKCCVRPVAAPAGVFVRARAGLRGGVALSRRFVFVARPLCGSLAAFCVRVTPAVCRMSAKQDGLRYVSFLFRRGSGSPVVRSRVDVRLSDLAGSLRVCAFSGGDPDGVRKRRGNAGDEERSRRRGRVRFCVTALALLCFPRGVRWGCAPQTAPKSLRLSGLSSGAGRAAKCALHGGVGVVRIRGTVTRAHGKTRPALISGGRTAAGRAGRAVYC